MTTPTVRGRVWRNLADVTPLDHDTANGPILIPAGWNCVVHLDGLSIYSRDGMPTHAYALNTCLNVIEGTLKGTIRSTRAVYDEITAGPDNDPLALMAPAGSWPPAELDRP